MLYFPGKEGFLMDIRVDPAQLIEKSDGIRAVNDSLRDVMRETELLVLSLNGSWQGDAERAYSEKIIYVKNQFLPISAFFEEYAELLKTFALGYRQRESDLTAKINRV